MAKLHITLVKSAIGYGEDQKQTLLSLGLKKMHSSVIREDTTSLRGMVMKVRHLVTVEEEKDETK